MNQVSLERDAMKHSLNRTMEESKRLVQEGDESVDFVTKNSEIKIRYGFKLCVHIIIIIIM